MLRVVPSRVGKAVITAAQLRAASHARRRLGPLLLLNNGAFPLTNMVIDSQ